MPEYKLTYFDIRGEKQKYILITDMKDRIFPFLILYIANAEHIRLIFVVAGIPYEEKRISFAEWPELKPSTSIF
jgi:hypothetical protein